MTKKEKMTSFFPQGIVTGNNFCDRDQERKYLHTCISENTHIVLSAPRRYGKTSLLNQVVLENHIPSISIDFLPANNHQYIKKAILHGAGKLLQLILPKHKQTKQKILQLFKQLNPKFTISTMGQTIELSTPQTPQKSIMEALTNLDKAAAKSGKRAIFIMDEFQQIGLIQEHESVEASIRHAVERSSNITYIFSGSNRHLLAQMFSDKNRPLYHLCEMLKINRISFDRFVPFLQKKAKQKWGTKLPEDVIYDILNLTSCHPYYVNSLCRLLWRLNIEPTNNIVYDTWQNYVNIQLPWITDEIAKLSTNQITILAAFAYEPVKEPQSQLFTRRVGLTPASIKRALNTLLKNDRIYRDQANYYHVLDPTILWYLNLNKYFNFQ